MNISIYAIKSTMEKLFKNEQASKTEKVNMLYAVDIVRMSAIHIKYLNIKFSLDYMRNLKDTNLRQNLMNLATLLGLTHLQEYSEMAYESGYFSKGCGALVNQAVKALLVKIRP